MIPIRFVLGAVLISAIQVAAQQHSAVSPSAHSSQGQSASPAKSSDSSRTTTAQKPRATRSATRRDCATRAKTVCASVPATWTRLGDVYDGLGFVVGEPNESTKQDLWNSMTVALVPTEGPGDEAPSAGDIMDRTLENPDGPQATVRRWRESISGVEVEFARIRVGGSDAERIEQIAFAQQGDNVLACVLNSTPQDADRLSSVWLQTVRTLSNRSEADSSTPGPAQGSGTAVTPKER